WALAGSVNRYQAKTSQGLGAWTTWEVFQQPVNRLIDCVLCVVAVNNANLISLHAAKILYDF
ncbi:MULTISPECIES: hypothetical protein, partial [unclassified Polaromonas]|uniref:hypothetical protein n=1 Tax=unclassified Polaromonas TaxID=2638319 RepID=UPI001E4E8E69